MVTTFSIAHSLLSQAVVWVTIAVIIFFILFGKRMWVPMARALDARASAIEKEIAEAGRLREEAEAMLKDAEARRHAALEEAKGMLAAAKREVEHVAAAARAEAEQGAERRERLAIERIAAAQKAAITEVRSAAIDIATAAASAVIRQELDAASDGRLVDRAIANLPAALARKVA
ncbi:MAG: F0F1 ATP synthase subunit B [Acetobacteraceae bacterium]